jgi:hypothetical protein
MNVGDELYALGWKQGAFLSAPDVAKLSAGLETTFSHGLVLSQDCDLACGDLATEPTAEVLFLCLLDEADRGKTDGKSLRSLHLEATASGQPIFLEAKPWHRRFIAREQLLNMKPSGSVTLDQQALRVLIDWIAERYTRTALPDNFVHRLGKAEAQLRKLFKKNGDLFWKLLIERYPEDATDDEPYEVRVIGIVPSSAWVDPEKQQLAAKLAKSVNTALSACEGIEVVTCEAKSEDEVPISLLRAYRSWDVFNNLTRRGVLEDKEA